MARDPIAREAVAIESPYSLEALLVLASSAHGPEGHLDLPRTGVNSGPDHDHLVDSDAARAWLALRRELAVPPRAPDAGTPAALPAITQAVHILPPQRPATYDRPPSP